jgi:PIN domain nuclease of toxin-antitoxin system
MKYLLDTHVLVWSLISFHRLERLQDPFDRMIIWQSISNGMTLLSKGDRMVEYEKFGLQLIW